MRLQIDAKHSALLFGFHPIHHAVALENKVGCFERIKSKLGFREPFNIQPFPEKKTGTMVSADFFTLSRTSLYGLQRSEPISLGQCLR